MRGTFTYRVKIEPIPENKASDPSGLWRLVAYQYEGPLTKGLLFVNVLKRISASKKPAK
jgi:hypothetical protein